MKISEYIWDLDQTLVPNSSKFINFASLLTTFEMKTSFWVARSLHKVGLSLKPNYDCQVVRIIVKKVKHDHKTFNGQVKWIRKWRHESASSSSSSLTTSDVWMHSQMTHHSSKVCALELSSNVRKVSANRSSLNSESDMASNLTISCRVLRLFSASRSFRSSSCKPMTSSWTHSRLSSKLGRQTLKCLL